MSDPLEGIFRSVTKSCVKNINEYHIRGRFCDSCEVASSLFTFELFPPFITSLGFPCSYACVTDHRVLFIGPECERLRRKTIQMALTDLDKHLAYLYIKRCLNHCLIRDRGDDVKRKNP